MALSWHRRTVERITRRARGARFSPPQGRAAGASHQKERAATRPVARVEHTLALPHHELAKEIACELVGEIASEIADEIVVAKQNASVALTGALLTAVRATLRDHRKQQAQRLDGSICVSKSSNADYLTTTRLLFVNLLYSPLTTTVCEVLLPGCYLTADHLDTCTTPAGHSLGDGAQRRRPDHHRNPGRHD